MNPTTRWIAAMVFGSLAFEEVVVARAGAVKPPQGNVARPTSSSSARPAKPVKAPAVTTVKSVKPVKSIKLAARTTTTKSTMPAIKVDGRQARSTAKADARLAKSTVKTDAKVAKSTAKTEAKAGTTSEARTPTAGTAVVTNPTADKISRNPKLAAKIAERLPAGLTLAQASTGFKNQGQFIAAVNVSRNLGIDFVKLQAVMTGQTVKVDPATHAITTTTTGVAPLSLGQSIQKLSPGVDADTASATARTQTSAMVLTTAPPPTTGTTTPTTATASTKNKGRKTSGE